MLPDDVFDRLTLDNKSALAAKLVGREVCFPLSFTSLPSTAFSLPSLEVFHHTAFRYLSLPLPASPFHLHFLPAAFHCLVVKKTYDLL